MNISTSWPSSRKYSAIVEAGGQLPRAARSSGRARARPCSRRPRPSSRGRSRCLRTSARPTPANTEKPQCSFAMLLDAASSSVTVLLRPRTGPSHPAAFCNRHDQVDDLDAGFRRLGRAGLVLVGRRIAMDRPRRFCRRRCRPAWCRSATEHVHDAADRPIAGVADRETAAQPLGRAHRDRAHAVAELLLHLEREVAVLQLQCVVDLRTEVRRRPRQSLKQSCQCSCSLPSIAWLGSGGSSRGALHSSAAAPPRSPRIWRP